MWGNLMANFGTNASGETSCPNEPMQIMVAQFELPDELTPLPDQIQPKV